MPQPTLLNGWKEIARYLDRGVRTVQRWEHELHMPARRPHGRGRSAVVAMSDELDAWVRSAPVRQEIARLQSSAEAAAPSPVQDAELEAEVEELRRRAEQVRAAHDAAVAMLAKRLQKMELLLSERRPVPWRLRT